MSSLSHIARYFVIGGTGVIFLAMICFAAGGRFNTTRSIPLGLYWLTKAPVTKDAYVMFCPPESALFDEARERGYISAGFCPGNYGFMMKRILASADDRIEIGREGVRINGVPVPASGSMKADKAGRALPHYPSGTYTLGETQLLLMSDRSRISFDGRYFGPMELSQVRGVIRPILTW
jgi:conjugative transfer signal peptidase TraF